MFKHRAYMLDISRDRVPTMPTLKLLVDLLAKFNYNQLQLYTEHTFAYAGHEAVWRNASPMTPQEVHELDLYCQMKDIELVPNQNSFGHLERWLTLPEYNHLAELPRGGAPLPWGGFKPVPTTLCPTDPESLKFLAGLYDQLLPNFSSKLFNIGCDETFDLLADSARSAAQVKQYGEGRVYLTFLTQVADLARARGKQPMFWGDIILKHPELVSELPKDLIALNWGYEGNHPFNQQAEQFAKAGLEFYVCPGTSSWQSLAGRVENMRENMASAEAAGKRFGAKGFMVTDWGDGGHWQPLACSLPGLILGGCLAYDGERMNRMDLEDALNSVLEVPLGGVLLRLGTLYLRGGALRGNCSELHRILANDRGYSRHPNLTDAVLTEISSVAEGCRHEAMQYASRNQWAAEIAYMANLVDAACHRRDERRLKFLRAEHARIWQARSRPGGMQDSANKLPRF